MAYDLFLVLAENLNGGKDFIHESEPEIPGDRRDRDG
jgi:hypothetical protein